MATTVKEMMSFSSDIIGQLAESHPRNKVWRVPLYYRKPPFEDKDWKGVLAKVSKKEQPEVPECCPDRVTNLMRRCWSRDPKLQPTIQDVLTELKNADDLRPTRTDREEEHDLVWVEEHFQEMGQTLKEEPAEEKAPLTMRRPNQDVPTPSQGTKQAPSFKCSFSAPASHQSSSSYQDAMPQKPTLALQQVATTLSTFTFEPGIHGLAHQVRPSPPPTPYQLDPYKVYRMQSLPRGLACIINNKYFRTLKTRVGTDVDTRNLEHVFQQLGFNVETHKNLRAEHIQRSLQHLAQRNHTRYDCLIIAILTHGIDGGAILGTDEHIVNIDNITRYFYGEHCPTMAGKPKVFFLQACRGERFDSGVEATASTYAAAKNETSYHEGDVSPKQPEAPVNSLWDNTREMNLEEETQTLEIDAYPKDNNAEENLEELEEAQRLLTLELKATNSWRYKSKLPNQSDMLLAFCTVPGYVSWRNSERGSWFVQALCETLLEDSRKEDLLSMMTMVNDKVAALFESSTGRHKQMPAPVTMLRKKLYFFPGYFAENTVQGTS